MDEEITITMPVKDAIKILKVFGEIPYKNAFSVVRVVEKALNDKGVEEKKCCG